MKSFKEMLAETTDKPKSPDEQNFLDKHIVDKRDHPVAPDDQFSGEIKGKKKKKREADREEGQDKEVYEEIEAEEEIIVEGVLEDLAKIVKTKSIGHVKFKDGKKQKVDLTTASMPFRTILWRTHRAYLYFLWNGHLRPSSRSSKNFFD